MISSIRSLPNFESFGCLIHSDGGKEEETREHVAGEELPSLAKEVAQVESVRAYAGKVFFLFLFGVPSLSL